MHCVRTVRRHNYRVKSGKHLPWRSLLSELQKNLQELDGTEILTRTALFFFYPEARDTRRGMENHFFSYMSQCQTLKSSTCCPWHWDEPFPSHPFFIAFSQLWISTSVTLKNASWHRLKVLFVSSMESRLYSGPYNLRCQWYWLYLADWSIAKINKASGRALRPYITSRVFREWKGESHLQAISWNFQRENGKT